VNEKRAGREPEIGPCEGARLMPSRESEDGGEAKGDEDEPAGERRHGSRESVEDEAEIVFVRSGVAMRGQILDLSVNGCRIRTEKQFPVGIYTRVETAFRLEGLPFRLGGVIQAVHDKHTVGIRFLDVSERKRELILELIGEIVQMDPGCAALASNYDARIIAPEKKTA
jgi:PilZ domain